MARCARLARDRRDARGRVRRPHRGRPGSSAGHAVTAAVGRRPHAYRALVREPAPAPVPRPSWRPDPPVPAVAPVPDRVEPARRRRVRDTRRACSRLRRQRAPDPDRCPDERFHADEDAVPYVADELSLITAPRSQQWHLARKPLICHLCAPAARTSRAALCTGPGTMSALGKALLYMELLDHS
jgi:hypothetical protein